MEDLAKMDLFFIVTTVAVIVVAGLFSYGLYRIIRILRHVERITEMAEAEGKLMREDIASMRASLTREGFKLKTLFSFIRRRFKSMIGKNN